MTETMSEFVAVPLWNIKPSRWQPREAQFDAAELYELAQSIKDNGLINPVLVFADDDADGYIVWELIAGERRTRATAALRLAALFPNHTLEDWCGRLAAVGLHGMGVEEHTALRGDPTAKIAATVHAGRDMQRIHVMAVIENIDRASLTPIEEGRAYTGLMQAYGWSQREVAGHVNKSQGYVAQRIGLTSLNETATNALNTRVINMTHARAISAVPEALQAAATEYVVHEVVRDDTPATTRQIENQLRALTAFVDPARWEPNGERVYTPQTRNRLAAIRMLLSGPYAEDRIAKAWEQLRAYKDGYNSEKNLLTAKPLTVVDDTRMYAAVTNALGMRPEDAWQNHAQKENAWCSTCIFGDKWRPLTPSIGAYCPRWKKGSEGLRTCEGWIGDLEPQVIPVTDYDVRQALREVELIHEPFAYTDSVESYLTAYEAATQAQINRAAEKHDKAVNGPRLAIQAFYAWQQTLPHADLNHSQAHACAACRYFEPLTGGAAPCRFAEHPLTNGWGEPCAPKMGVLYGPRMQAVPRCEMFTRRALPEIYQQPGFSVGKTPAARRVVLRWMKAIKANTNSASLSYPARTYLWRGLFAWLCPLDKYEWDDVTAYLYKNWEEIGDGGIATLLDALILEKEAGTNYRQKHGAIALLDLATGQAEPWMPVGFEERQTEQKDWPEGWSRPWMQKPLVEVFDEAGMLEESASLQL